MENVVEHRKRHHSEGDDDAHADRRVRPLVESARMSGSVPAATNGQRDRPTDASDQDRRMHLPSPPDSECSSSGEEDDEHEEAVGGPDPHELAGYEYCAREAIRFLMEEERLDAEHPMVRQLRQHLFDGRVPPDGAMDHPAAASARQPSDDLAPRQ